MGFVIEADTDFETAVEEQLEELDVFAFVSGSTLPTSEVTIYTDADAALRVATLLAEEQRKQEERAAARKQDIETYSLADEDDINEEELTALHNRLVASSLTFSLRGIAPAAYNAIEKSIRAKENYKEGAENEEYNLALNNTIVAESIVSVLAANGKSSDAKWDAAKVEKLMGSLYPSEANKLYFGAQRLVYVQDIFDAAVSADFS